SGIRRGSAVLVALVYAQILFGAVMRHKELAWGTRLHILLAFAVVAVGIWLGVRIMFNRDPALRFASRLNAVWFLWGLLALQVMLGLETMLSKFEVKWGYTWQRVEPLALSPDLIRSLHFLVGA